MLEKVVECLSVFIHALRRTGPSIEHMAHVEVEKGRLNIARGDT
jgi:hypothetical protein